MTGEAALLIQTGIPIKFTCADGTGIEKGAILKLASPNTVSLSAGITDVIGGIAAVEKIADDGVTQIAVHREGVFRVLASGSVVTGDPIGTYGDVVPNAVGTLLSSAGLMSGSRVLGICLEDASDTETFKMELKPSFLVD